MLDAFFLPVEPGQRFCVLHRPPGPPRRTVLYIHPFAEEMNKARRMAALQARRLADQGMVVLQLDLYGCGDSSGEFGQARWEIWQRDIEAGMSYLAERFPAPMTLWGLRLGALLAAEARHARVDHLLLWQPVSSGSQFLSQFLRLRLASEMLASGAATTAQRELMQALKAGRPLEIAGYELHPDLAAAMESRKLESVVPCAKRIDWIEVVADRALSLRPASAKVLDAWRRQGIDTDAGQVVGEPFWSTIEIAVCEELLATTSAKMAALQ